MMINNGFSWERMSLLARYYMPAIKKQLLIYLIIIAVYFIAGVMAELPYWFHGMFLMLWGIVQFGFSYLFYLAPIVFSRYDDNTISTLLPARGEEKALFVMGYSLIFVPLFIFVVSGIFSFILSLIPGVDPDMYSRLFSSEVEKEIIDSIFHGWSLTLYTIVGYFWMTSITLYVVTVSRSNKVMKAILATIVVPLISGILLGIAGIVAMLYNDTFSTLVNNLNEIDGAEPDSLKFEIISRLGDWILSYQGIMVIIGVICLVLTWRKICRRQV
ncbi:MAG: hypothetical protein HDS56_07345 [Barnesiella sp.]|nr:hypothetical protein [Barnesiella sp.]MBD5253186.1 hypothetical protein [Barnesiella sp.]